MKVFELFKRMFFERSCAICGEPVSYDEEEPICKDCEQDWFNLLTTRCNICGCEKELCTCMPRQVTEISKSHVIWCVFYDKSSNQQANRMFYRLKQKGYTSIVNLMADRISQVLVSSCYTRGIRYKQYAITYVPRRKSNKRRYMFDQSEKIAKALSKKLNIPVFSCLENNSGNEQKKLSKADRIENAINSYKMKKNAKVEYENVFLVDDIITTGASMRACAIMLYENGAKNVIPVAFAKDNFKKGE